MRALRLAPILFGLSLMACAPAPLFPRDVTQDINQQPGFGVLQAQPDVYKGRAVQLAGRIIGIEQTNEGTLVVAQDLPLFQHPAYGPAETESYRGQFAFLYPGALDPASMVTGNKFVVVGLMKGNEMVTLDGNSKSQPIVVARCFHVWKTGPNYEIEDFPHTVDGYYPLPQETFCAK